MNNIVREFIESNIKYIEKQQWYFLFLEWYVEAESLLFDEEPQLFDELLTTLSEANTASPEDTLDIRTVIVRDMILHNIETEWEDSSESTMRIYEFYNLLNSELGLKNDDLHKIAVKILKDKGYNLFDKNRGVTKL